MRKIFLLVVIGVSNILTAQGYITGGYPIHISEAPHQVSLQSGGRHFCGGSIINKQWIVTAAHCIGSGNFNVNVGMTKLDSPSSNTKSYDIEKYIVHPQYGNGHVYNNDIALVKIKGTFSFNQDVKLVDIELSTENLHSVGQQTKISGWGRPNSNSNSVSNELLMVDVPIISNIEAQNQLRRYVTDNMIATSSVDITRKGACQGDSGGPLTTKNTQNITKLIGIVSWGDPYCSGGSASPSIYTKVANYVDWIKQYVSFDIAIQGNSVICDNTTQTYVADTNVQWELSNDIEKVSETSNSITIRAKQGFNGLATLTASNGNSKTTKKIWVGKPKVEYDMVYGVREDVNYYLTSKEPNVSLEDQGITSIVCRDSDVEPFTNSSECKSGKFYSRAIKWWAEREVEVSNACGVYNFNQLIRAPYIDTNPCNQYKIAHHNLNTYRLALLPCEDIPDNRLHPYSVKKMTLMETNSNENNLTIQISNAMGQIVLTTQNAEFSLAHLLAGTYYARVIKNGQVVHTQTLLKR